MVNPLIPLDRASNSAGTQPLMHGRFPASDAIALLSAFVHSKIRYHEERIARGEVQEEDLLMRERRIIELQQWLRETRERMQGADEVDVEALFHWRAV